MNAGYFFREALRHLTRSKRLNLICLGAISMALMALGVMFALQAGILKLANFVEAKVEVVAFLNDQLAKPETEAFIARVRSVPQVAGIAYVSKEEALAEFSRDPGLKRFVDALGTNPLPASVRVQLQDKTAESVAEFVTWLNEQPGVEETAYGGGDADRLLQALRLVRLAVVILAVSLVLAAVIIIGNIISLMVFARREEISIMRTLGATNWFVRGPFLLWGLVQGTAGTLVALGLLYGLWRVLVYYAWQDVGVNLESLLPPEYPRLALLGALCLLGTGAGLGLIGSLLSVGRQLRE